MLRELYRLRVLADPGREALCFLDRRITHGEWLARLDAWHVTLHSALARLPAVPRDGVWASYGGDTAEHLLVVFSGFLNERPLLLLPLHAGEEELASLVRRADVQVVLSDRPLPVRLGMERRIAVDGPWALWTSVATSPPDAALPPPEASAEAADTVTEQARQILDQVVGLSLSSGTTTGSPTIQRSSAFVVLAMLQHPEWPRCERMLAGFRMQLSASRTWAVRTLMEGATLCAVRESERAQLPLLAGALDADCLAVAPASMEQMLAERLDTQLPASVRFLTGTDRVPAGLRRRFHTRFPNRLMVALANSRLGPLTLLPADQLLAHDGESVGLPLANVRFDFLDNAETPWQGTALAEATVSKTWRVRLLHPEFGPLDLEHTESESRPGDLLRRWPDGHLSFGGRANDVFLFRSALISPFEIENLLADDPAVEEVVAFGAPSSIYGAVPMAAVRLREGRDAQLELPRLRRLCQAAMGYRAPKSLIPLQQIPRGPGGKPLRRELAQQYALT